MSESKKDESARVEGWCERGKEVRKRHGAWCLGHSEQTTSQFGGGFGNLFDISSFEI